MSELTIFKDNTNKMNKRTIFAIIFSILFLILFILIKTNSIESFDIAIYNLIAANISESLTSFFKIMTFLGEGISIASYCIIILIIAFLLKKRTIGLIIT